MCVYLHFLLLFWAIRHVAYYVMRSGADFRVLPEAPALRRDRLLLTHFRFRPGMRVPSTGHTATL